MYHIDFNKPVHVHFIGIGGISMSGLADILYSKGFTISGSDMKESELTQRLKSQGIKVTIGQAAENITDDIDVVVYTAAINKENPEFQSAISNNKPMLTRAQLLGEIMTNYKVAIGVSGTHGKTTTTSMLTEILLANDMDPTVSVGGMLHSIGGNLRVGSSQNFITEACEYTNSFLSFFPTIGIILNVQEDHLDFFKDINDIRHSFKTYAELIPADGLLVINNDIDDVSELYKDTKCQVITVGHTQDAEYTAKNITYNNEGCCSYTLVHEGKELSQITLGVPGIHNVYNSLAAIATAIWINVPMDIIVNSLEAFHGTDRRFQKKGVVNGVTIIDDYAHHPAEIDATLASAANYPHKKLIVAFQPHTYTRTKAFLYDFAKSLSKADVVILADIYAAREKNTIGIYSSDLKTEIDKYGTECIYEPDFDRIASYVKENAQPGDLFITMGAGNIVDVAENLIR